MTTELKMMTMLALIMMRTSLFWISSVDGLSDCRSCLSVGGGHQSAYGTQLVAHYGG
jgi:hypothetical protein